MKDQINKYARGAFEYEVLTVQTSQERIDRTIDRNKDNRGSLRIFEKKGRAIKGLVYSSNNKVRVVNAEFSGEDNVIEYTIDTQYIEEGDRISGELSIVSNGGEKTVEYEFQVQEGSVDTSCGNVKNLIGFTNLAQNNPKQATEIFAGEDFQRIFLKDDFHMHCLYNELIKANDTYNSMEEFLIGIHKKNRVDITLSMFSKSLNAFEDELTDKLVLSRNTWGNVNITVDTDCDFIEVESRHISTADFTDGKYELTYRIVRDKLHSGKNMGRIKICTMHSSQNVEIIVHNDKNSDIRSRVLEQEKNELKLVQTYIDFKLHKITIEEWTSRSEKILEKLISLDESNPFYSLVMCQVLITDKKVEDARFYLTLHKDDIEADKKNNMPLYCYYMYLNVIYRRDHIFARETMAYIKNVYDKQCNDWRILWILLFLDEEMAKNKSLKLLRIKEQFNKGMRSPLLYIEACAILNEQPMLLRMLNSFEVNILLFACKHRIIEEKLLRQTLEVAAKLEVAHGPLFVLLEELYSIEQDNSVLEVICATIVKNNLIGRRYFKWYDLGIEKNIKVNGLFEGYLQSCDRTNFAPLPKVVLLYFSYSNDLPLELRAYLYANVIKNRSRNEQIYKRYIPQMQTFVQEQLNKGNNDEYTAVVMQEFFSADMVNEKNAANAGKAIFSYVVLCENPNMKNLIIAHNEILGEERYQLVNGRAVVAMYSDEAVMIFEDESGRRYADSVNAIAMRVYDDENAVRALYAHQDKSFYLEMYFGSRNHRYHDSGIAEIRRCFNLSQDERLVEAYRRRLLGHVVDYYFDYCEGRVLDDFLEELDISRLSESYIIKYAETLIAQKCYEKAFDICCNIRFHLVNSEKLFAMCEYIVAECCQSFSYDKKYKLCRMLYVCFQHGRYSASSLQYLENEFVGTMNEMMSLWKKAVSEKCAVHDFDEKLIVQALFTHNVTEQMYAVYRQYSAHGTDKRVEEAYLAYNSYEYFVREQAVDESIFDRISLLLQKDGQVVNICRMAWLKWMSVKEEIPESLYGLIYASIDILASRGLSFSFYENFGKCMKLPYNVASQKIVEFRANPSDFITISCNCVNKEQDKGRVEMKNIYGNIFIMPFRLFYGEKCTYEIHNNTDGESKLVCTGIVENGDKNLYLAQGRFEMLNDMLINLSSGENRKLEEQMFSYRINEIVVERLFGPMK